MTQRQRRQRGGDWKQGTRKKTQAHAEAEFPERKREEEENEKQYRLQKLEKYRNKRTPTKLNEELHLQKKRDHRSLSSLLDEEKELVEQVQSILDTVEMEVNDIRRGRGPKLPTESLESILEDEDWKYIPRKMDEWLAREIAVHTGDMYLHIDYDRWHYYYEVYGHITEETMYLLGCVIPLEIIVYGLKPSSFNKPHKDQTLVATYYSKPVALFKSRVIGLPVGKKRHVVPPLIVRRNRNLMCNYVCEICSTDGLIGFYNANREYDPHKYPRIQIRMTLKEIIETLAEFVTQELGIDARTYYNIKRKNGSIQHMLTINGKDKFEVWRKTVGISNPSKISKVMVWEKYGICPPYTTILQRFAMISDIIDPMKYKKKNLPIPPVRYLPGKVIIDILAEMRRNYGYPLIRPTTLVNLAKAVDRLVHVRNRRRLIKSSSSFSYCINIIKSCIYTELIPNLSLIEKCYGPGHRTSIRRACLVPNLNLPDRSLSTIFRQHFGFRCQPDRLVGFCHMAEVYSRKLVATEWRTPNVYQVELARDNFNWVQGLLIRVFFDCLVRGLSRIRSSALGVQSGFFFGFFVFAEDLSGFSA